MSLVSSRCSINITLNWAKRAINIFCRNKSGRSVRCLRENSPPLWRCWVGISRRLPRWSGRVRRYDMFNTNPRLQKMMLMVSFFISIWEHHTESREGRIFPCIQFFPCWIYHRDWNVRGESWGYRSHLRGRLEGCRLSCHFCPGSSANTLTFVEYNYGNIIKHS